MVTKNVSRRSKRTSRFRPKKSTRAIAKRAERIGKTLARTREVKYANLSQGATAFANAGNVIHLTQVAQGDTSSTRDGAMLACRSIKILGTFDSGGSNVLAPAINRVIIFQDKQQVSDASPAVTDILLTADPTSLYNYPLVRKRFKILYDKCFTMSPGTTYVPVTAGAGVGTSVEHSMVFKRWVFPTAKNILYNGTTVSDIQKNGVYILFIGSNQDYQYQFNWQMSYTDS